MIKLTAFLISLFFSNQLFALKHNVMHGYKGSSQVSVDVGEVCKIVNNKTVCIDVGVIEVDIEPYTEAAYKKGVKDFEEEFLKTLKCVQIFMEPHKNGFDEMITNSNVAHCLTMSGI